MNPLLQAILDNPDDDAIRLVYADFLEDGDGDHDHAEYIRLAITANPHDIEAWNKNCQRRRDLLTVSNIKKWFPGFWNELPTVFSRASGNVEFYCETTDKSCRITVTHGFVEELFCTWKDWVSHHVNLLSQHPIRTVTTTYPTLATRSGRLRFAGMPWIRGTDIHWVIEEFGNFRQIHLDQLLLKHYWPKIRFNLPYGHVSGT